MSAEARREKLVELYREASVCERCELSETRTKVVFGAGDADADLMFVGEAPGADEDRQGLPFVGRAGGLLNQLLEGIGLDREKVFIANVLKCLRYNATVQLADGSWERIGRLVKSRYAGDVMSVAEDGELVQRRVVGWHATPLAGRGVCRLTYRSAKRAGLGRVGIELTGDHPVLTDQGYVPVADLGQDARVATGQGMTDLAFDVSCGSLLGDASIRKSSSSLTFSHSARQRAYAEFKLGLLQEFGRRQSESAVAAVSGGAPQYGVVHGRTLANRALRTLRADFYGDQKIVPRWLADSLNPRMLAFWFMDDGHMRVRAGGRRPSAEIATNAFSDDDIQVLLRGLARLGLAAKSLRSRIYLDVENTRLMSELIAPFVPACMRHKVSPEVEPDVAFDPERLSPRRRQVMFDAVEVLDISERPRADTTFFCIDVEETGNFVTAGGVVHNCRPPGNRDPQPAEIEACRPYLFEQVRLIEPKVVATLGNFSTKLLTGNQTGITRVRGTPQVHRLGERTVSIFPLLHPAVALRRPRMRETLVEDFGALSELLKQPVPELPKLEAAEEPAGEAAAEAPSPAGVGRGTAPPSAEPSTDQLDIFGQ